MIRKVNYDKDLIEIHELVNSAFDVTYGSTGLAYKKAPRWPKNINHDWIKKDMENMYVYVENHKILGCVRAIVTNDTFHIGLLAVSKEHQQRGIGSKLVEFAESFAKRVEIEVFECRTDIIPFWEKKNYKEIRKENIENLFPIDRFSRPDIKVLIYEKVLI